MVGGRKAPEEGRSLKSSLAEVPSSDSPSQSIELSLFHFPVRIERSLRSHTTASFSSVLESSSPTQRCEKYGLLLRRSKGSAGRGLRRRAANTNHSRERARYTTTREEECENQLNDDGERNPIVHPRKRGKGRVTKDGVIDHEGIRTTEPGGNRTSDSSILLPPPLPHLGTPQPPQHGITLLILVPIIRRTLLKPRRR